MADIDSKGKSNKGKRAVHVLLVVYGAILAYIVGGLIFGYEVNYNFYFALSFALFIFALGQAIYEYGVLRAFFFLLITSILGFAFEVLGTNSGFLFGKYSYSDLLGEKILGVPAVVPLAWFVIASITFSLALSASVYPKRMNENKADRFLDFSKRIKLRALLVPILLASFGTVAWDFGIDPMFSHLQPPYWTWQNNPAAPQFYQVPLSNFVGWFILALLMLSIFACALKLLGAGRSTTLGKRGAFKQNTLDSRIAYLLLMIDAGVANATLGQYYAVLVVVAAMGAFMILTYSKVPRQLKDQAPSKKLEDPEGVT